VQESTHPLFIITDDVLTPESIVSNLEPIQSKGGRKRRSKNFRRKSKKTRRKSHRHY
jgi:hypothetical protein